jgi:ParB family transcriptional regulator, chromosome partitioning protein
VHVLMQLRPEQVDRSLLPAKLVERPRRSALELAQHTGLVEPIVVRRAGNPAFPRYELLCGRAALEIAERAVLPGVPAVVIESISDSEAREFVRAHLRSAPGPGFEDRLQPAELLQVLDAIEQAKVVRIRRHERCSYSALAQEYGISSVLLSHLRRVKAKLHRTCLEDLIEGRISLGHAKALTRFPRNEQPRVATRIIRRGSSVRQVEASARRRRRQQEDALNRGAFEKDPDIQRAERVIAQRFGWRTQIAFDPQTQGGSITFHFDTLNGFEYLLEQLGIDPRIISE